jgi:signal transduction histidine kinase
VNAQIQIVLIAAGCTGGVGLIGLGVIRLLRRASLRLSLQAGSALAVLAIVAGTLGTARAMFLSQHDLGVVVMVCVVAGVVAFGFCWLLGRQIEAGSLALRRAARTMGHGEGGFRSPTGPMAAELAALSRELAGTARKLDESRRRERRLEQSRRQLVAWVSHDLRTPLAGLGAMAEALEDGMAADPARYHRQIRAEVTRLAGMVDDLFELSRIQSGTLQLSLDEIDLSDLISDAVASTEALARAQGVRLTAEASGPLAMHADPRELARALANLMINAIHHTPEGGGVHVSATADGDGTLLAVADGCGGIPDAELARVFDTAWRGTRARTPGTGTGAGLGLAIVRGIVEAHHGRVSVVNTGGGCRFEVRLPALSRAGEAGSGVVEAGSGAAGSASGPGGSGAGQAGSGAGGPPGSRPPGMLIPGL